MEKQLFISIEEMLESRIYDGISDLLFDLQRERKHFKVSDNRYNEINDLQNGILKELSFEKLVWIIVRFSRLRKEEVKEFSALFRRVIKEAEEKWEMFEGLKV
jgi:hypothetical protein